MDFIGEVRRRGVLRAAALYAGVGWILVEVAAQVGPFFDVPGWIVRLIVVLVVLGFPIALLVSWFFEFSFKGVKLEVALAKPATVADASATVAGLREKPRRMAFGIAAAIIVVLLIGGASLWIGRVARDRHAAVEARRTIAVLPFSAFSNGAGDDLLAAGLQDSILTSLASLQGLKVISRTSVMELKSGPNRNLKEIAKQLGVGAVVEGSLQRLGQRILVQTQLIDANTDEHLWAHAYDLNIDDLFTVEIDLAHQVASAVRIQLSSAESQAIARSPTPNAEAYAAYVRAQHIMDDDLSKKGLDEADALLDQALKLDGSFALAHYAHSRCDLYRYYGKVDRSEERLQKAKDELLEAERLNPDLPELHIGWGRYYFIGRHELPTAEIEFHKAVELMPNSAESLSALGTILQLRGQLDEAVIFQRRAIELNPLSASLYRSLSVTFQLLRDYPSALALVTKGLALYPHDATLVSQLVAVDLSTGDLVKVSHDAEMTDDPDLLMIIASAEGDLNEAVRQLMREPELNAGASEDDGLSNVNNLVLGELEFVRGNKQAASDRFSLALQTIEEMPSSDSTARVEKSAKLAIAYAALGKFAEARNQLIELANRHNVENPVRRSKLLMDEIYAYLLLGEFPRAVELMHDLLGEPSLVSLPMLRVDPLIKGLCNAPICAQILEP